MKLRDLSPEERIPLFVRLSTSGVMESALGLVLREPQPYREIIIGSLLLFLCDNAPISPMEAVEVANELREEREAIYMTGNAALDTPPKA